MERLVHKGAVGLVIVLARDAGGVEHVRDLVFEQQLLISCYGVRSNVQNLRDL